MLYVNVLYSKLGGKNQLLPAFNVKKTYNANLLKVVEDT